jgi:hypothetical protein
MAGSKSTGWSGCATGIRGDLKVAATNPRGRRKAAPRKAEGARQSGGNEVQREAQLTWSCLETEAFDDGE